MMWTHGGATQAHMDAYVVPTWLDSDIGWSRLNRAINRSGLNRTIRRSRLNRAIKGLGLNCAIGWLKSHGV